MAKPKLPNEVKMLIVQSLACGDTPSAVATLVKAAHQISISRQTIESYDPTKAAGARLSAKFRAVFEATRAAFFEDIGRVGISHRVVRLRALQRMAEKAEECGNNALAARLLKQAAEEVGGSYTNRRELTGKDGKDLPVPVSPVTIFQLPDNGGARNDHKIGYPPTGGKL